MKISIVIPTLNEAPVLSSAVEQAWLSGADEIIVVDGGSRDGSLEIAKSLNCIWLDSVAGRGTQLNTGAAIATGDVLLFLHADCSLVRHGCNQIRTALSDHNVNCGAFRQKIANGNFVYRMIEAGNSLRLRMISMAYGDQGIFVRRQLFGELGGFDEVPLMEDFRFSQKIRRKYRYQLLPGPLSVSPRRWETNGPLRQTLKNWSIAAAHLRGVDPSTLAKRYRS